METTLKIIQWFGLIIFCLCLFGVVIGLARLGLESIKPKKENNKASALDLVLTSSLENELKQVYLDNFSDRRFLDQYIDTQISYEDFEKLQGEMAWDKARILIAKWEIEDFEPTKN